MNVKVFHCLIILVFQSCIQAKDWPAFLGPNGNDVVNEELGFNPDLSKWSKVWENNIGVGYTATVVADGMAFNMSHDKKETETLHCFDSKSGKPLWRFDYNGPLINKLHKGGPNSTPTIEGEFVFIMGKAGQAFCLNKTDGSVVWQKDLLKSFDLIKCIVNFPCHRNLFSERLLSLNCHAFH